MKTCIRVLVLLHTLGIVLSLRDPNGPRRVDPQEGGGFPDDEVEEKTENGLKDQAEVAMSQEPDKKTKLPSNEQMDPPGPNAEKVKNSKMLEDIDKLEGSEDQMPEAKVPKEATPTPIDPTRDSADPLNEPPEDMDAPDVKTGKSENMQMSVDKEKPETDQDPNRDSAEPLNEPPEDMDATDVKTGKPENTQMSVDKEKPETDQDPNRDSADPLNEPPEDMDAPDVKTGKSENTQMSEDEEVEMSEDQRPNAPTVPAEKGPKFDLFSNAHLPSVPSKHPFGDLDSPLSEFNLFGDHPPEPEKNQDSSAESPSGQDEEPEDGAPGAGKAMEIPQKDGSTVPNDGVTSAEKTHGLAKEAERTAVEEAAKAQHLEAAAKAAELQAERALEKARKAKEMQETEVRDIRQVEEQAGKAVRNAKMVHELENEAIRHIQFGTKLVQVH